MHRLILAAVTCACASGASPTAIPKASAPPVPAMDAGPEAEATTADAGTPGASPPSPPAAVACIVRYYDAVARRDGDTWSVVVPGGETTTYDGTADSFGIKEIYEQKYPTGPILPVTTVNFDPGRVRIDSLFFATYGKTAKDVQAALVPAKLGGVNVFVHRKIAEPLRRVSARLDPAMKKDPSLARFFTKLGGTFNWRVIAGTKELSMHSWGIAIDLSTELAHYWRSVPQTGPLVWKNSYPQAIVDAFESEGFVWGGRWYHFDTMHFEYRPELLDPSCYPIAP